MKVIQIEDARHRRDIKRRIEVVRNALQQNLSFMKSYRHYYSAHDVEMMGYTIWEQMFDLRDLEAEYERSKKNTTDTETA